MCCQFCFLAKIWGEKSVFSIGQLVPAVWACEFVSSLIRKSVGLENVIDENLQRRTMNSALYIQVFKVNY